MRSVLFTMALLLAACSHVKEIKVEPVSPGVLYHSCVQIIARAEDGRVIGRGSGTLIATHLILTAYHVVDDAKIITVERIGHTDAWARTATLVAFNKLRDLAALEVKNSDGLRPIPLMNSDIYRWETCWAVGYALGISTPTLTDGRLQDLTDLDLRYSAQGWFGSSGGGVFIYREGSGFLLVSVTQRLYVDRGNVVNILMIGASPNSICDFLKENKLW